MSTSGNVSTAVRNQRAPRLCEADDDTRALWRQLDWFATPPWATRAGAEIVKQIDPQAHSVWEPACGDQIMSSTLAEYFIVDASDIYPQPPARVGDSWSIDFLDHDPVICERCPIDWVITNPPFALARQFAEKALTIASNGVALLCRLNWLESADRYPLFRDNLVSVAVFSERVPMQLGPWDPDCSSATAYAWFFFARNHISGHALRFIPPGTKARLTRPDDVRRFATREPPPLFG